ncbi:MAG: molecular chaperone HtpG [Saprospiraceae bacterium]|nr:molecular chaperone HtpG [Saprospiraceae bacterium]
MAKTGQISVQTENIFPIIKKFLYSDQEIFLRELVSNAVDACQKLKTLASKGEATGELGDLRIEILLDEAAKTITIRDNGIGMTSEEVEKYLNQVAFSSASEFLEKYKNETNIIGHFGLGFYSAFMVADNVEVLTKSYKEGATAVRWTCDGNPSYTLEDIDKDTRGTDIILHINEEGKEYLDKYKLESLLTKYCKFLPVTIQMGTRTETTYEGEGDDRKEIKTEVPNIINDKDPLWKKNPLEITEEEYKNFYRDLYPMSSDPLFWIHLNIDYPFNLTGILYFPKISNDLALQKNKIQLYSNQVYVTDEVKDIVPEFLTLLHGVIDSPDIPLNVSRSYLQADANVKKITGYITRKVAEKLQELYNKDLEGYQAKWSDIGVFVKYGIISDEKFAEKAMKFALFQNVDKEFFAIEAYDEKIKALQTDKNNKLVHIYSTNPTEQYAYIQAAKNRSYDVLLMDHPIDNHFIQHLEYKLPNTSFVRVDADTADQLIHKDEKVESVLNEQEKESIKGLFENIVKATPGATAVLKDLSPTDDPISIVRPEFMRRMKEMQALQGMSFGDFPDAINVNINTNHPLICQKILLETDDTKKNSIASYLVQLAKLQQNMLKGEELNQFVHTSISQLN